MSVFASDWLDALFAKFSVPKKDSAEFLEVRQAYGGLPLAAIACHGLSDLDRTVESADNAQGRWSSLTAAERCQVLHDWATLVLQQQETLARLIALEQGKILAEARAEVQSTVRYINWFAEEAKRPKGEVVPPKRLNQHLMTIRRPIGVVGAITPWNFPLQLLARKVAPALAAGCAVVSKPAPETPLSALALQDLAFQAGLDRRLWAVLLGDARRLGKALCQHAAVRMLSFTGSSRVGKELLGLCAPTVKKTVMELGGNAPFVACEDADLDKVAEQLVASRFRNSGQTCVATNRALVQRAVLPELIKRLKPLIAALRCGDPLDPAVDQGPLIHAGALARVEGLISRAVMDGAEVLQGGAVDPVHFNVYQPTLLCLPDHGDVTRREIFQEEIFGPVLTLTAFGNDDEAIHLANATRQGLAAYVFSRDTSRLLRIMEGLEFGMVGLNNAVLSSEAVPFGGMKESGLGREGGHEGLESYCEIQYVNLSYA